MTNPDYTAMLFIIDRSGSMTTIRSEMEASIESILEEQAKLPGKLTVDVAYFDYEFNYPVKLADPTEAQIKIVPRGSTALHDAIVYASAEFGESLGALPEDERPGIVLVTVVTDGFENSSQEATSETVKEVITRQRESYSWDYTFLGANQDAVLTAQTFGLREGAALNFSADTLRSGQTSVAYTAYASATRSGQVASF